VASVRIGEFEWDEAKANANVRERGVTFEEATVFPMVRLPFVLVVLGHLALGCGGARAIIQSAPAFRGDLLNAQKVLVLPIAVSSDYVDDRTGISLDGPSRFGATHQACAWASKTSARLSVVCFDNPMAAPSTPASDMVLSAFAHDQVVANARWSELGETVGARYAVLFRPESQSAVHHESHADWLGPAPTGGGLIQDWIQSAMRGQPYVEHGYTISGILVDLRTGAIMRAGMQSREAPDPRDTSIDFDARPVLCAILEELLAGLLDPH
jgi:hypothetical protein